MSAPGTYISNLAMTRFVEALNDVISKGVETSMAVIYNKLGIEPGKALSEIPRRDLEFYTKVLENAARGDGFTVGF